MRVTPVEAGHFKLDGGAMFGVVPKTLWSRTNPADENNLIYIAARCLLIQDQNRIILIDTGMGAKQSARFFSYYQPSPSVTLKKSLLAKHIDPGMITDVFLTHLHFDHCGGAVEWNADQTDYQLTFPNATYWSTKNHWQWATQPNPREKASFLKENILPIEKSGQLQFVKKVSEQNTYQDTSELGFGVLFADGHTDKQMLPIFSYNGNTFVFAADLLPTVGHIPLPYVMGYDTRPLITLAEKEEFLNRAANEGWYICMEHDPLHEIITVQHTEKGVRLKDTYTYKQIFDEKKTIDD